MVIFYFYDIQKPVTRVHYLKIALVLMMVGNNKVCTQKHLDSLTRNRHSKLNGNTVQNLPEIAHALIHSKQPFLNLLTRKK